MSESDGDLVGRTISSIRILELLGEGGMGRVYRGYDERLGREVAIKEVRPERRLDENARARFRREARILSRLEHPNICRVYELIETSDCDYLVLELVRGRSLRHLLKDGVERRDALQIAVQIAAALDAAHAMSVVHRDLKPENVMIDDSGAVRVLDFGLARSAEDGDGDVGLEGIDCEVSARRLAEAMTRTSDLLGTPRYMSPEQARREVVTAASDLFSFGLVLQELWTGRPPYSPELDLPQLLGLAMWGDVDRPHKRSDVVAPLVDRLLELDPNARPTAAETVQRLQKILEAPRRRLIRGTAVAAVACLVVAVIALAIGYSRMKEALAVEAAARVRSDAMRALLVSVLTSGDPAVKGPDTRVQDVLADSDELIDQQLAEHPLSWASAHRAVASSYMGLGLYDDAARHYRLALERLGPLADEEPLEHVSCTQQLAMALLFAGELDEAEQLARRAFEEARARLSTDNSSRWIIQSQLGTVLSRRAQYDEAEPLLREASAELERLLGLADVHTLRAHASLHGILTRNGRIERAVQLGREHLARCEEVLGAQHPDTLRARANLAANLREADGFQEEAIAILNRVVADSEEVLGEDHPSTLLRRWNLGVLYKKLGRLEDAELVLRQVLDIRRRVLGDGHPEVANTLSSLGGVLGRMGRFDEGEAMLREAVRIFETAEGPEHPYTLYATANLGNLLKARGDLQQAGEAFAEAHRRSAAGRGPTHGFTIDMTCSRAQVLAAAGRRREAVALLDVALARLGVDPDDPRLKKVQRSKAEIESN